MKNSRRIEVTIETHETTVIRLNRKQPSITDSRMAKEVLLPAALADDPDQSANQTTNQKEQNNEEQ